MIDLPAIYNHPMIPFLCYSYRKSITKLFYFSRRLRHRKRVIPMVFNRQNTAHFLCIFYYHLFINFATFYSQHRIDLLSLYLPLPPSSSLSLSVDNTILYHTIPIKHSVPISRIFITQTLERERERERELPNAYTLNSPQTIDI